MEYLDLQFSVFVVLNFLDLGSGAGRGVKDVAEPFLSKASGQFDTNDTLAHAENLAVVRQDGSFNGEGVVSSDGPDALDLVCGDSNTETGATNKNASIGLAVGNHLSALDGNRWIRFGSVCVLAHTNINDLLNLLVLLNVSFNGILVLNASVVAAKNNFQTHVMPVYMLEKKKWVKKGEKYSFIYFCLPFPIRNVKRRVIGWQLGKSVESAARGAPINHLVVSFDDASGFLLFPEKEAKSVVLLRRRLGWAAQTSAKPTLGVWGRAPRYIRCEDEF
jgi:hypothetical protein